jgi:hypothetical protein
MNFCCFLRNQFVLLSFDLLDFEVEWLAFERKIFEAMG